MTIDEIEAMMKNNGYGLMRKIEDEGWMGIEFLKADGDDGTHKISLIRKFYNKNKPKKIIDTDTNQYKLL